MLPYRDSRLTRIVLIVFFVLVAGYAYFEARSMVFGPAITTSSDMQEVHDPFITIKGRADRITSLAMNGKTVRITEDGTFDEPYLLAPGYNRIVLVARDKYGRSRTRVIEIVYTPTASSTATTADGASSVAPQ